MSRRTSAGALVAAAVLVIAPAVLVDDARAEATGPVLVAEDFRSATAAPGFVAYGAACLTGAPAGAPGPGGSALGGCPEGGTGPVPPSGGAPDGYLRLTDAAADQVGAVLYTEPVLATSGVEISFEQWQYGGNPAFPPADGLSFFLVDGTATLDAPGAFGGSLGYAQKLPDDNPGAEFLPGVEQGYLGIGLDVLGNYFGDWEHRGDGCAQRSPAGTGPLTFGPGSNMVTVRGPGDGTQGYCFLTASTSNLSTTGPWPSTLPGSLQGPTTALPPGATPAEASALLEPSRRTVTITITPAPDPQVSVTVDFGDGAGPQQVLAFEAPQPVPASYSFGFAASTGLFSDVHLVRTVQVRALVPLPELTLVKTADAPGPFVEGEVVDYTYEVTSTTSPAPITAIQVEDDRIADVSCDLLDLGPAGSPEASTLCHGSYVVTAADALAGSVTNTAFASGTGADGGAVVSEPAVATVLVGGPGPTPTPTPSPSVTPTPSPAPTPSPSTSPAPVPGPTPTAVVRAPGGAPPPSAGSPDELARSGSDVSLLALAGALAAATGLALVRGARGRRQ